MNDEDVVTLVTTKPDAELAAEFKKRIAEAYQPMLLLFDEIKAAGFDCQCGAAMGALGRYQITSLRIIKEY